MKKISFAMLAVSFVFSVGIVLAQEIEADSWISQVTVYPRDALINRTATVKLGTGESKVIFSNIIPEIDENSLRVSGEGSAEVKILGAQVKREFLKEEAAEKIKQLQQDIENLEVERRKLHDSKEVLSEEKQFLDSIRLFSNGQIPKDLVTRMPSAKDLEDTLNFLDRKLRDNYLQAVDIDLKVKDIDKKIDVLRRELAQVSGPARKLKRSIEVELETLKPGSFELNVSYLVRAASWQPIYDARADFERLNVELVSYGLVRQNTGEDWQDVELSLSTAKPAIGGRMPYVSPWILRPFQPRQSYKEKRQAARMMDQMMAFDKDDLVEEGIAASEAPLSRAEEKGIAVVYKLTRKTTIKSDGSEHKLPISSQLLKADFEYSSYPRAASYAYLGSRVTNAKGLQLLAGRVNIFLQGDFVGTSSIDNIGPEEEFDLYLGVDENVKVKREQIEKKVDETLIAGIPSSTRRTSFKYKLTVENYKSRKINVKLFEAMPVSEDDRIKVKVSNVSLEPKEKDWKDRKGVWLWQLSLEPKQKQEIFFMFSVEHPRDLHVEGP